VTHAAVPPVPQGAAAPEEWRALESGAVVIRRDDSAAVRFTGTGRVACLQGLVTCDVVKPGDGSRLFGALLTNKGMIVAPLWIARLDDQIVVELPAAGLAEVMEILSRSLPPRLCHAEDVSATHAVLGVYGAQAGDVLTRVLGQAPPAPAGAALAPWASGQAVVAASVARGAAGFDVVLPVALARAFADDLLANGAVSGSPALLEVCRIEAGIPRLGAEIDDRTLPQEVRCEELGAISYTKGCYLGQETVARIHFRGHANRRLTALALDRAPPRVPVAMLLGGRAAGRLTSAAWSNSVDAWIGLGVVRRDIEDGASLQLETGGEATVRLSSWLRAP
jgi:folate-binding protein YgfZ